MFRFILNAPYTIIGLLCAVVSVPLKWEFRVNPSAFIFRVSGFWWALGYMKGMRAMAIGHVVLLGSGVRDGDIEHELVHIEQYHRIPVLFPFLYFIELMRKGYKDNKYEKEAYERAGNIYSE